LLVSVNTGAEDAALPPSQWLLINTSTFAVAQRWTADQKLIPAGISGTRIAVAQRLIHAKSFPYALLVKNFVSGNQTTLPADAEPGYTVFASDGTLVFGTKATDPNNLNMLRHGAISLLGHASTPMFKCTACNGLVAAAATPRVVAANEPIQISSWTTKIDWGLRSFWVADLGATVTEQVLKVPDGMKIKNAGPFALSPDGRNLAMLVGETLYLFNLPPVGSGQPFPLGKASPATH
jgi:hypothetical protein